MTDDTRSSREIEREIEQERAELRGSLDQLLERMTFEDVWERTGAHLRENRSEYGHTLGRMIKEKPLALVLTAVGIGWLLFGPAAPASRDRNQRETRRRRLSDADRHPYSAPPLPAGSDDRPVARATQRPPEARPTSGAGAEVSSRDSSTVGSAAGVKSATSAQSTAGASEPAKAAGGATSDRLTTSSHNRGNSGETSSQGAVSPASSPSQTAKDRPAGSLSATSTSTGEGSREDVPSPSASSSTSAKSPETKPQSSSERFDQGKDKPQKTSP